MADPAPILYIAPSVDPDASAGGAGDWFRGLDRERWRPSLIVTEPSLNRGLPELAEFAAEVWDLPELMPGSHFPEFILGFIESREVSLVHIADARLALNLLPDMASLRRPPAIVAQLRAGESDAPDFVRYAARRYGNLIDAFSVASAELKGAVAGYEIAPSRIEVIPDGPASGAGHGELYARLLAARPASSRSRDEDLFRSEGEPTAEAAGEPRAPVRLPRTPPPERSVGVIVPCYRHGIFLDGCIASIKAQTLTPASVVVVDDGSDDLETVEALARLDDDPAIEVVRLGVNGGPSIARNRGLDRLETSYVLSIDADDELLPDALERMLAQLEAAPENVGFVYPHAQHIGNRNDYVQLPAYNLWLLMKENYCPAPALFDRRVFDGTGIAYPEDVVVGHEDWDLILQLGERDVRGIHADGPTFLYRKQGFSRVNAVDYGPHSFHEAIERRHAGLYGRADEIKASWAPALSIVLLGEGDEAAALDGFPDQTCADFEIVAGDDLTELLDVARGRWVCVLAPGAVELLRDAAFVEKLLYSFVADERDFSVVLAERPDLVRPCFARLDDEERLSARPVGAAFVRTPGTQMPRFCVSRGTAALAQIAVGMQANGPVQWRLATLPQGATKVATAAECGTAELVDFSHIPAGDKSEIATRYMAFSQPPRLPELTPGTVRRWSDGGGWTPSGTQPLCRHVDFNGLGRVISNDPNPPPGYRLEHVLGAPALFASPGTRRLVYEDNSFVLSDDQNQLEDGRHGLGYVEEEPLPMLIRLELRRMPACEDCILVAGEDDPVFERAEPVAELGWIEALPVLPRLRPPDKGPWGVDLLWRGADSGSWRHTYAGGDPARVPGDAVPLGALYRGPDDGLIALRRRDDGRLVTDVARPGRPSRDPRKIGRWVAGSGGTNGRFASPATIEARLRRLAGGLGDRKPVADDGVTLGWLWEEDVPGSSALFSSTHQVTGDQLVTRFGQSAIDRGYALDGVLGYILVAGAADEGEEEKLMAPWGSAATAAPGAG